VTKNNAPRGAKREGAINKEEGKTNITSVSDAERIRKKKKTERGHSKLSRGRERGHARRTFGEGRMEKEGEKNFSAEANAGNVFKEGQWGQRKEERTWEKREKNKKSAAKVEK